MDFDLIVGFAEIVAAIATVSTLLFVGLELRASRIQNRMTMLTTLDRSWNEVNAQIAQDKETAELMMKGMSSPLELTDVEATRFFFLACQAVNIHKSVFTLMRENGLSSHHQAWFDYDVVTLYSGPGFQMVFNSMKPTMEPDFISYVEERRKAEDASKFLDWRSAS